MRNMRWITETDDIKRNAQKFRDYAAECRRLAQRAPEKDRKVLMEIADAWDACAQEAERKENSPARRSVTTHRPWSRADARSPACGRRRLSVDTYSTRSLC